VTARIATLVCVLAAAPTCLQHPALVFPLLAAAIVVAAFFAGTETGFYNMNLLRMRCDAEAGRLAARRLQRLAARPRRFVTMTLIGVNVAVYLATLLATRYALAFVGPERAELAVTLILSPVLLVTSEIIPKTLYQLRPDTLMGRSSALLVIASILFRPAIWVLDAVEAAFARLFRVRPRPRPAFLSPRRVAFFLTDASAETEMSPYQKTLSRNILRLKSVPVHRVMTPLGRLVALPDDASPEHLARLVREHPFSRFPVYQGSPDSIIGLVHVMDVLTRTDGPPPAPRDILKPVHTLSRNRSVADALYELQTHHAALGVVTDTAGRARGIVTAKDLVEEIVGELEAW
jgi:putative hemolysin